MTSLRAVALASVAVVVGVNPLGAQDLSRYRAYALESSVASVVTLSGVRQADTRTSHERPAKIQEIEWRAPYSRSGSDLADPVHDLQFSFYEDQLYQVVVTYDRDRMEGLTDADVIESLSATYGVPLLLRARTSATAPKTDMPADTTVVARWEDAASLLTLSRGTYAPQFQLVLISKSLNGRALAAIREARRLDTQEAPQRALDLRQKEVVDARAAGQKARVVNKPAFRP
jgi:hypothetical protein